MAEMIGVTMRPEKVLDSSGCNSRHCPPVCSGLLLGRTCDEVLTVLDSLSHKLGVFIWIIAKSIIRRGMNSGYERLLRIGFLVLAAGPAYRSVASPQETSSERGRVLAALTLSYGASVDSRRLLFTIAPDYVLTPTFSADGLLIEISIEPKSNSNGQDRQRSIQLSRPEFELILANVNSIKPLGALEEEFPAKFVHGGRAWGNLRHQHAYLQTAEPIGYGPPSPIAFAYIYYLHSVTGMAKIPRGSKPEEAGSFGLVCIGGEPYIAPKTEFTKLWSNPFERQTVELAGPTRDDCGHLP